MYSDIVFPDMKDILTRVNRLELRINQLVCHKTEEERWYTFFIMNK